MKKEKGFIVKAKVKSVSKHKPEIHLDMPIPMAVDHIISCKSCGGIFYTKDIKVTECYGCEVLNKGF